MKKVIVFIMTLIMSYALVQWGSGLVLTLLYEADPFTLIKGESTPLILHLMPFIVLLLPIMMAYYITVKIIDGGMAQ